LDSCRKRDKIKIIYVINNGYRLMVFNYNMKNYLEEALFCELKNENII